MQALNELNSSPALYALVPCAGIGERAAAGMPKQYAPLLGQPVIAHTLGALAQVPRIERLPGRALTR